MKILTPTSAIPSTSLRLGDQILSSDPSRNLYFKELHYFESYCAVRISTKNGATEVHADERIHIFKPDDRAAMFMPARCLAKLEPEVLKGYMVRYSPPIQWMRCKFTRVDPYVMGVYLGDGSCCDRITTADEEMPHLLESCNAPVKPTGKLDWVFPRDVKEDIIAYGLKGKRAKDKFIPQDFLFNSFETRVAVLQGLLDTDGTCKEDSSMVSFSTASPQLAYGVMFLVRSIGGIANHRMYQKGKNLPEHRVHLWLPHYVPPFKLKRRLDRYKYPAQPVLIGWLPVESATFITSSSDYTHRKVILQDDALTSSFGEILYDDFLVRWAERR